MKITKVEAIPFHIPFDPDFHLKFAYRTSGAADHVLIRIFTDDGLVGIAEAPARLEIYGETQKSILALIDQYLGPYMRGRTLFLSRRSMLFSTAFPTITAPKVRWTSLSMTSSENR